MLAWVQINATESSETIIFFFLLAPSVPNLTVYSFEKTRDWLCNCLGSSGYSSTWVQITTALC